MNETDFFCITLKQLGITADKKEIKKLLDSGIFLANQDLAEKKIFLKWCGKNRVSPAHLYLEMFSSFSENAPVHIGRNLNTILSSRENLSAFNASSLTHQLLALCKAIVLTESTEDDMSIGKCALLLQKVIDSQSKISHGELLNALEEYFSKDSRVKNRHRVYSSCAKVLTSGAHKNGTLILTPDLCRSLKDAGVKDCLCIEDSVYDGELKPKLLLELKSYAKELNVIVNTDRRLFVDALILLFGEYTPNGETIAEGLGTCISTELNETLFNMYTHAKESKHPFFKLDTLVFSQKTKSSASAKLSQSIYSAIDKGHLYFVSKIEDQFSNSDIAIEEDISHFNIVNHNDRQMIKINKNKLKQGVALAKERISKPHYSQLEIQFQPFETDGWYEDYLAEDFSKPILLSNYNVAWKSDELVLYRAQTGLRSEYFPEVTIVNSDYATGLVMLCHAGCHKEVVAEIPYIQSRLRGMVTNRCIFIATLYSMLHVRENSIGLTQTDHILDTLKYFMSQPIDQLDDMDDIDFFGLSHLKNATSELLLSLREKGLTDNEYIVKTIAHKLSISLSAVENSSQTTTLNPDDDLYDVTYMVNCMKEDIEATKINNIKLLLSQYEQGEIYPACSIFFTPLKTIYNDGACRSMAIFSMTEELNTFYASLIGKNRKNHSQFSPMVLDAIQGCYRIEKDQSYYSYNDIETETETETISSHKKVSRNILSRYSRMRMIDTILATSRTAAYLDRILEDVDDANIMLSQDFINNADGGYLHYDNTMIIFGELEHISAISGVLTKKPDTNKIILIKYNAEEKRLDTLTLSGESLATRIRTIIAIHG
ncbi:hypothetical protein [Photobacterium kishitanii]|uniref:Uncharacterized protein n=1 Tax=Photobacterium kishitanii TaxID=318456 RepID=A0A2T3KLX9_9GAMM|nr:hypothetical protein [Photobacterium kishitanii]PSV00704.1 hypothetical protein C9J27_06065 [Photobacterium kishitanii]